MNDAERKQLEDAVKNDFPWMIQLVERTLDLKRWGFRQTFAGVVTQFPPSVIYDSEWCRVRFMWHIPDSRDRYKIITAMYGRLHAPVDERIMPWKGQSCYCWHFLEMPLNFLDGASPQEMQARSELPPVMGKYYRAEIRDSLAASGVMPEDMEPVGTAMMHAECWEQYGQRLFDLFDLRRPASWENFRQFVQKYYELYPQKYPSTPPCDHVC